MKNYLILSINTIFHNHFKLPVAALILISAIVGCKENSDRPSGQDRPNIILFLVDDMGWQDTSVPFWTRKTPFNDRYHTPNMERLARQGMKFTQAYATPVCSPTRISLMTGMNAARHRVTNWTLRKNTSNDRKNPRLDFPDWHVNGMSPEPGIERTVYATALPALLQEAGYFTIHCGKAHFGAMETPGADPETLGFEVNIAGHAAGAPKSYRGTENFGNIKAYEGTPWAVPGLDKYHGKDIFLTEALTREAKLAMESAIDKKQPFFLYMAHYAVHTPIQSDPRYWQKYLNAGLDSIEASYASMVEGMDKSLGDLMDFIEEKKVDENTIILFMSDNGGLSAAARGGEPHTHNRPLSSGKGSSHEGGIREPMIVRWPGLVKPNSVNDHYLIIEDFFPTILEMAGKTGYETVQQVDGISFVPLLTESTIPSEDRPLFWHFPNEWGHDGPGIGAFSAVRRGDWKLIYFHRDRRFELFNLIEDIGETHNLAAGNDEKLQEMSILLTQYLKEVDAQMPVDKETGKLVDYPEDARLKM